MPCDRFTESGHRYDSESGWCLGGCGRRDDGRITGHGGSELKPPTTQETTTEPKETQ
jgi:hypothetical protein